MSLKPTKIEYEIGESIHGQKITLTWYNDNWSITKHAVNQRDDTQTVTGIPNDLAAKIGELFFKGN